MAIKVKEIVIKEPTKRGVRVELVNNYGMPARAFVTYRGLLRLAREKGIDLFKPGLVIPVDIELEKLAEIKGFRIRRNLFKPNPNKPKKSRKAKKSSEQTQQTAQPAPAPAPAQAAPAPAAATPAPVVEKAPKVEAAPQYVPEMMSAVQPPAGEKKSRRRKRAA